MRDSDKELEQCQALDGKGFYIDTPHIFAKIRKQLTLLVF